MCYLYLSSSFDHGRSASLAITSRSSARHLVFFFFQAEDGIRDYKVTGVQTCALPISGCLTIGVHLSLRGRVSMRVAGSGHRIISTLRKIAIAVAQGSSRFENKSQDRKSVV